MRCKLKPKVEGITKCKERPALIIFPAWYDGEKQRKLRAF
jgi:hypothetical protein